MQHMMQHDVMHIKPLTERETHRVSLIRPPELLEALRARQRGGAFYRRMHPSIMWAKLRALADGARIASERLWGAPARA